MYDIRCKIKIVGKIYKNLTTDDVHQQLWKPLALPVMYLVHDIRDPRAAVAMDYSRPRHGCMALRLTVPTRAANLGGPRGHPAPFASRFHRNSIHVPLNLLAIYWKKMVMVAERLSIAPAVPVSRGLARSRPPRPTAPAGFGARWPS